MDIKFINTANEHKTEFEYFLKNIFPVAMIWEGGGKLHNVPGDTGGQTIWGIAYNKNKQFFSSLADHRDTTEKEAAAFAFVQYYLPLRPQYLPCNVKLYCFDMAYNMGMSRAKKYMQECAGVKVDGIFGPQTELNLRKIKLDCLHKLRVDYYHLLAKQQNYKKFLKGWLNRANDVYKRSK